MTYTDKHFATNCHTAVYQWGYEFAFSIIIYNLFWTFGCSKEPLNIKLAYILENAIGQALFEAPTTWTQSVKDLSTSEWRHLMPYQVIVPVFVLKINCVRGYQQVPLWVGPRGCSPCRRRRVATTRAATPVRRAPSCLLWTTSKQLTVDTRPRLPQDAI